MPRRRPDAVTTTEELVNVGAANKPDLLQARIEERQENVALANARTLYDSAWRQLAALDLLTQLCGDRFVWPARTGSADDRARDDVGHHCGSLPIGSADPVRVDAERRRPSAAVAESAESVCDANEDCDVVVLHWCGLRDHNAVVGISSLSDASECVRVLAATGFTATSISTVALVGGQRIDALVGVHSDDPSRIGQASEVMRAASAHVWEF